MSMTERQIKIVIGSLLHDIGKIIYRSGKDSRKHAESGYDFLLKEIGLTDNDLLNSIKYHHYSNIKSNAVAQNDICYLVNFADSIALGEGSKKSNEDDTRRLIVKNAPLESVFNILNNNDQKFHYSSTTIDIDGDINFPTSEKVEVNEDIYLSLLDKLTLELKKIEFSEKWILRLLSFLEVNTSYIPSSIDANGLMDISLFDHVKLTAGFASCIEAYLLENSISDYKTELLVNSEAAHNREMFLFLSMDISGIQNFIYTISTDKALKQLRARSLYLEILMEHLIDELLSKLNLTRANLIYSGGGHSYLVLPNTELAKKVIDDFEKDVNVWFIENFDVTLYIGVGYAECSANALNNKPTNALSQLHNKIYHKMAERKYHRYTADEIIKLNNDKFSQKKFDGKRECSVCKRVDNIIDNRCPICNALEKMSVNIMNNDYFVVTDKCENELPLPFDKSLKAIYLDKDDKVLSKYEKQNARIYKKNLLNSLDVVGQNLWVGDYHHEDVFTDLVNSSTGVKKLAVLRADVDNLGKTFIQGFSDKYASLTRTAVLSRQLSLFFKCYIKTIFTRPSKFYLTEKENEKLAVTIVYSGGDDVFLVGAWDSVFEAFTNLKVALSKFTQDQLSISGGIGIYPDKYPISVMASEVAELEECSKHLENKNGVTYFDSYNSYSWPDFINSVIGEKFKVIKEFMDTSDERGKAFLYNILDLLRNDNNRNLDVEEFDKISKDKINIARLVYLLSRLEPNSKNVEKYNHYKNFAEKIYKWVLNKESSEDNKDLKELISALLVYVYLTRDNNSKGK